MKRLLSNRVPLIVLLLLLLSQGLLVAETTTTDRDFGPELPILRGLGLDGSMDATVEGDTLYVIGRGSLHVADISQPVRPKIIGRLSGLGNTRQIEIHRGVAYVTAREDGLFVIDVSKREKPTLLCHYDSIELATGVALSGNVAFVACRTAGVELVDISNPRQPVHLSTVRTGEAQSVVARNGVLYAGVWGSRELVICDVSNPYRPAVISKTPLDGNGDGVAVRGNYCFVATGHHARGWRRDQGDASPQYGAGHGLEIFDVSDPAKPVFVSRVKTRRFYRIGMDMWDVMLAGNYAFLSDTYNGVFVIDISDIKKPRFVGHRQLAAVPRTIDGLDTGESLPAPVGGIALAKDTLFLAGAWTDLHVVGATGMACLPVSEPDPGTAIPEIQPQKVDPRFRVYRPNGQVYGVAFFGDTALVAAGTAGLHAVSLWPEVRRLSVFPTDGFARDVAVHGDQVYVAEATGGLSIWRRDEDKLLKRVGRYRPKRGGVAQIVVPPPGRYALLHVGQNELQILDVSNPQEPTLMLTDKHLGLFYTFPLARDLLDSRYACCLWHASGYRWYDLHGEPKPIYSGDHFALRANFADGIGMFDGKALVVTRGKYALIPRDETRSPEDWTFCGIAGNYLSGKPTFDGNTMYLSNRVRGTIKAVDISQIESPRLLADLQLDEHPGPIVVHNSVPVIPAGYQGLIVWDEVGSVPSQSSAPASRPVDHQSRTVNISKARKVLFLGNSITRHGPAPAIGWSSDWGMAASVKQRDFVHLVTKSLAENTGTPPDIMIKNISEFERQYATYDFDNKLKEVFQFNADLIMIAIGENVPQLTSDDSKTRFADSFEKLLKNLRADNRPTILVRSCFWPNEVKDRILEEICREVDGIFVDIGHLGQDESNYARSEREYGHAGVAAHPGDKGMQAIADAILDAIGKQRQMAGETEQ